MTEGKTRYCQTNKQWLLCDKMVQNAFHWGCKNACKWRKNSNVGSTGVVKGEKRIVHKKHLSSAPQTSTNKQNIWAILVVGGHLDQMNLEDFSSLHDSMILHQLLQEAATRIRQQGWEGSQGTLWIFFSYIFSQFFPLLCSSLIYPYQLSILSLSPIMSFCMVKLLTLLYWEVLAL